MSYVRHVLELELGFQERHLKSHERMLVGMTPGLWLDEHTEKARICREHITELEAHLKTLTEGSESA